MHSLTITYGSTTIDLTAGTYQLLEYVPRAPDSQVISVESPLRDGGEQPAAAYRNVSEVIRVALMGEGSVATLQAAKQALERALWQARTYQTRRTGEKVYLVFQPEGSSEAQRSEILGGRIELADEALGVQWLDRTIEILIGVTRRFYWEGPETQLVKTDWELLAEVSDPEELLSGYDGLSGVGAGNSNAGRLYFTSEWRDEMGFPEVSYFRVHIWSDAACTVKVGVTAECTSVPATVAVSAVAGSGLGGTLQITNNPLLDEPGEAVVAEWRKPWTLIYNHHDSGHDNMVDIAAASVGGDLPAPVRIELRNNHAAGPNANHIYIAQNVSSAPETMEHMLEGEAASGITAIVTDTHSSGGEYGSTTWNVTSETALASWTLSEPLLEACAGNYFRLLGRMVDQAYTNLWLRWKIYGVPATPVWEGPQWLAGTTALQDMGVLPLPPYLRGAGNYQLMALVLTGQRATAGSHTLKIDYVQVSALDGWRTLKALGTGFDDMLTAVDDGINDLLYVENPGVSGRYQIHLGYGEPIQVWPGQDQRLMILHDAIDGSAAIERTMTVRVYYRPRRLTL